MDLDGALVGGRFVMVGGSRAHFNDIGPAFSHRVLARLGPHEFTKRIQFGALSCIKVLIIGRWFRSIVRCQLLGF